MVNEQLSTFRESKVLERFLEENEGLVTYHGQNYETESLYFFITESKENKDKVEHFLRDNDLHMYSRVVDSEEHMKCDSCQKIIADYHAEITESEVLCLQCNHDRVKASNQWFKVDNYLYYRYVSDNFIEVITMRCVKSEREGFNSLAVTDYFDVFHRLGATSTLDQDTLIDFFDSRNMDLSLDDKYFIREFGMPRTVFIIHNMDFEKGGKSNFLQNKLNSEPVTSKQALQVIGEYLDKESGWKA